MKKILFTTLTACLFSVSGALAHDTTLYTHCLRWTPQTSGEVFYALAAQEGYLTDFPPVPTVRTARTAYKEGVAQYWALATMDPLRIAGHCMHWITKGTAALGW